MRPIYLLSFLFVGLGLFFYFSNKVERVRYSEEIEERKCLRQFPLLIPKEFTTSNTEQKITRQKTHKSGQLYLPLENLSQIPQTEYKYGDLSLIGIGLKGLPDGLIKKTKCISRLYLAHNQLLELPKEVKRLTSLNYIDVSHNLITTVEKDFFEGIDYLENVDFSNNNFDKFPIEISYQQGLTILNLDNNSISSIPSFENEKQFTDLRELYLNNNQLEEFPVQLGQLPSLKILALGLNFKRKRLEAIIDGFPSLQKLNLENSRLLGCYIKANSGRQLTSIHLSNNNLEYLKIDERLFNVNQLYLLNNELKSIPKDISRLPMVENVYLSNNNLFNEKDFEKLKSLENLKVLFVRENKLTRFPDLSSLINLKIIDFSSNQLTTFPQAKLLDTTFARKELILKGNHIEVLNLDEVNSSIKVLNLANNQLTMIRGTKKLPSLEELNLSNNRLLKKLTVLDLANMPHLKYLDLSNTGLFYSFRISIEKYCEEHNIELIIKDL